MAPQPSWLGEAPAVNHSVSIEIEDAALANSGLDSDEFCGSGLPRIVGNSAALRRVLGIVGVVAPTDATVLINGETALAKNSRPRSHTEGTRQTLQSEPEGVSENA
jgi:transcriptional regulator with GAF, ATPase, and Fis domain